MVHIFNLLIISLLTILVVDYSGFVDEIGEYLTKILRSKLPLKLPKPFSCSLCTFFWSSIIYLLIVKALTFKYLAFVAIICMLIPEMTHLIYAMKGFINRLIFLFEHLTGQDLI